MHTSCVGLVLGNININPIEVSIKVFFEKEFPTSTNFFSYYNKKKLGYFFSPYSFLIFITLVGAAVYSRLSSDLMVLLYSQL